MLETVFDEAFSLFIEHLSKPIPTSQRNNYPGVGDFEIKIRMSNTNLFLESLQHDCEDLEGASQG